ncbi:hypothetical protein D3C85_987880 [compost metagenome]
MLGLQRGQTGAFLGQIGVHQVADADFQRVLHLAGEGQRPLQRLGLGAQGAEFGGKGLDGPVHHAGQTRQRRLLTSGRCVVVGHGDGRGAGHGGRGGRRGAALQVEVIVRTGAGLDADGRARSGRVREQVHAVEGGAGQGLGDFSAEGVVIGHIGLQSVAGRIGDRDRQALLLFQRLDHGFAGGQGHVDDGLTALHRVLHSIQSAHFGALVGGDGEDGAIVLGRRNLLAGVHTVLRDRQITARVVEVLQSNQSACIGIDAISHFGSSFAFYIFDVVLAS